MKIETTGNAMKRSTLSFLLVITLSLFQTSCMQQEKKQDPYKKGDIVTWKINDHLILKAKVGERREHVVTRTPRGEAEFYRPQYERYIGQFPIDYQPTRFDKISEAKATEMPISKTSGGGYEFNLMLNGSWVQASDRSVVSDETLDHPDQVKMVINTNHSSRTTEEAYLMDKKGKYEPEMFDKYQLKCDTRNDIGLGCFGKSTNSLVSGIVFSFRGDDQVKAISYEPTYGGIEVEWYFHRDNLQHWQEIDTAIWDLIDTWNISPITKNQSLIDNPREDLSKTNAKRSKNSEILTFKVTPELIVSVNKDETNPYNRSHSSLKNFLGQFAIDSIPTKQSTANISNIRKATTINEPLEFVFLLNGVEDYALSSYYTKPTANQIKVRVTNVSDIAASKLETATERVDYLLSLNDWIIKNNSKFYKHGMECYERERGLFCIGRTNQKKHSELLLKVDANSDGKYIQLESKANTDMYGGIRVEWNATAESFENWLAIDAAIWRLLEEINIASSVQNSVQTPTDP